MPIPRAKKAPWHWLRYRRVDAWVCGLHTSGPSVWRTPMGGALPRAALPLDDRWFAPPKRAAPSRKPLHCLMALGCWGPWDGWTPKGQRTALKPCLSCLNMYWLFMGDNTVDRTRQRSTLAALTRRARRWTSCPVGRADRCAPRVRCVGRLRRDKRFRNHWDRHPRSFQPGSARHRDRCRRDFGLLTPDAPAGAATERRGPWLAMGLMQESLKPWPTGHSRVESTPPNAVRRS